MVHASLSTLGVVEGGAVTVVEAMLEAVGSEGTVIMPSFRASIRSADYGLAHCGYCEGKKLCDSDEKGETGAISEALRTYPGAIRSCHPTTSWSGIGKEARKLLDSNGKSQTPCGTGSPFFPLMELNGKVLLLGVGANTFTNMHSVEDALALPYLSAYDRQRRHATYTTSGRRIQYEYPLLLDAGLQEAGMTTCYRMGSNFATVMNAREIGSFLWQVVQDNPWCLIVRPRGREYSPFEDACMKMARMVKTWKSNPDKEAWRKLIEKSNEQLPPIEFKPFNQPRTDCPAYAGFQDGYHRCLANDPAPWEKFIGYPATNCGVTTCDHCSWPQDNPGSA